MRKLLGIGLLLALVLWVSAEVAAFTRVGVRQRGFFRGAVGVSVSHTHIHHTGFFRPGFSQSVRVRVNVGYGFTSGFSTGAAYSYQGFQARQFVPVQSFRLAPTVSYASYANGAFQADPAPAPPPEPVPIPSVDPCADALGVRVGIHVRRFGRY